MSSNSFTCKNCKKEVEYIAWGTKNRNHCPFCLFSLHVDDRIGDRSASCKGLMLPIGKVLKKDGEEVIVHKCIKCGMVRKNRVAGDDDFKMVEELELFETLPQT